VAEFFENYIVVAVFAGFGALLVAAAVGAAWLLRPHNPSAAKAKTYECGVDPVAPGGARPTSATSSSPCCS